GARRRLTGCGKPDGRMGAVTVRLVLRAAAAAERGAVACGLSVDAELRAEAEGAVFADLDQVDGRRRLVDAAVLSAVTNGARRTHVSDRDEMFDGRGVRVEPRALDVRLEHAGLPEHAVTGVDASLALEQEGERLAFHRLDAVGYDRRG